MRSFPCAIWLAASLVAAQEPAPKPAPPATFTLAQVTGVAWRNVGPANMGGRVTDIEGVPGEPGTLYVASAGGGLWKTVNNGTTFQPLFRNEPTVSIGDVAVAPSNPSVVWVGTGEENARNSVSFGDGAYKSTDGGQTWQHMGLARTFQIGHIAIHPRDANIVYVAALGRLWGPNRERGVFRTRDGGKTWDQVLYLDERTGCIDVRVDPNAPNVVYAAMYERERDGFDSNDPAVRFGGKAGFFRSDDGGDTWKKLARGLPTCKWGRSGFSLYAKKPGSLIAIIETERSGWASGDKRIDPDAKQRGAADIGAELQDAEEEGGAKLTSVTAKGAAAKAGLKVGDVIVQIDEDEVHSGRELAFRVLRNARAGDKAKLTFLRAGKRSSIQITYGERSRTGRGNAYMGISGEDGEDGALLSAVTPGGPAAKAGLLEGDLIVQLGESKIASYNELIAVLRRARGGSKTEITIQRAGKRKQLSLTYGSRGGRGRFGRRGNAGTYGGRLGGQQANVQEDQGDKGFETGGVFRSDDRGETWRRINSLTDRPFYFSVIAVDPSDDRNIYSCGVSFYASHDWGKTFRPAQRGIHVDFHAIWIDPTDSDHVLVGCDGGINVSFDRCRTWEALNNIPIGQFYHAAVDNSVPYRIYGGLQDNGTWGGPSRTRYYEGITKADWVQIYGGDGFGATIDPTDPDTIYATSQGGNIGRIDLASSRTSRVQKPGSGNHFNWDTPFFLSPHNPRILYFAGNHAFRSLDRGDHSQRLTTKPLGLTERGTATAMAESPVQPGLLYVGTDDGALWRSKDGGHTWEEIHAKVKGLPGPRYVSSIQASHFKRGRVYATFDGHRSDDNLTHVFVSENMGDTWTSLIANLPDEPVHVCREDPSRENLLFLGTEFTCYVSLDRGQNWLPLGDGLPTVAVRDLAIQSRDSKLVAATHGRGIWVFDIAPLRQLDKGIATMDAHLFRPQDAVVWRMRSRGLGGDKEWHTPNPASGAAIYALFNEAPKTAPVITIHDVTGKQVASVRGKARMGLQLFQWNGRLGNPSGNSRTRFGRRGRFGRGFGRRAPPGAYSARLKWGEETLIQPFALLPDPADPEATANGAVFSRRVIR